MLRLVARGENGQVGEPERRRGEFVSQVKTRGKEACSLVDEFGRPAAFWDTFRSLSPARQLRAQAAPRAIAAWIEQFAPQLKNKPVLNVVVVASAENLEVEDGGIWYPLVPFFLERIQTVNVTILPSRESLGWIRLGRQTRYSRASMPRESIMPGARPAEFVLATLPEFLDRNPRRPVDLVVILDADLDDSNRWLLSSGGIEAALARGAVVALGANELHAYDKQRWLLGRYGFDATEPLCDTGCLRLDDRSLEDYEVHWADVLWQIDAPPASAPLELNPREMERLDNFEFCIFAAQKRGDPIVRPHLGQLVCEVGEDGNAHDGVGLPSGLLLDIVDGTIWYHTPKGPKLLEDLKGYSVPADILARYPDDLSPAFERALWSAETDSVIHALKNAEIDGTHRDALSCDAPDEIVTALLPFYRITGTDTGSSYALGRPTPGCEPLFRALSKGQWGAALNMILEDPFLVDAVNEYGETPAFFIRHKNTTEYQKLKRLGANLFHKDNSGYSLIHRIAQAGTAEAARFCLVNKVDVDLVGPEGWTPAAIATLNGNVRVLKELLEWGADIGRMSVQGVRVEDLARKLPEEHRDLIRNRIAPN